MQFLLRHLLSGCIMGGNFSAIMNLKIEDLRRPDNHQSDRAFMSQYPPGLLIATVLIQNNYCYSSWDFQAIRTYFCCPAVVEGDK